MGVKRLALDTSVLTYLVRTDRGPDDQLDQWNDVWELDGASHVQLVIPAPTYAEVYGGATPEHRPTVEQALRSSALDVLPFDVVAAVRLEGMDPMAHYKSLAGAAAHKEQVKLDWLIAACAARWDCDLCTYDPQQAAWFRQLAPELRAGPPEEFLKDSGRNRTLF